MNKTLAITAIVLVAVIMGMSAIAPALATPPATPPPEGPHPPDVDECDEVENLPEDGVAKAKLRDLACD